MFYFEYFAWAVQMLLEYSTFCIDTYFEAKNKLQLRIYYYLLLVKYFWV